MTTRGTVEDATARQVWDTVAALNRWWLVADHFSPEPNPGSPSE